MQRLDEAARWFSGQPLVIPVCNQPGHMVTSLAANGDSIIFGLLGYDATVKIHAKNNLKLESTLVQSREFPASVSSVDFNDKLIVTCAYESLNGAGSLHHAVYIWFRLEKCLASKLVPHSDMIRSIKITDRYLLTASNDTTIAITDISNPAYPKLVHRISEHKDFVTSVDCDRFNLVSVSVDKVLKVWDIETWKCNYSLQTIHPTLKVALSWPLAATGGQNIVLLWNIEKGSLIRELRTGSNHGLSCLGMTWLPGKRSVNGHHGLRNQVGQDVYLVAGGNQGVLSLWNTSVLLAGHPGNSPHRYIQVGDGSNMISSLAVDRQSVMTGDWCGHVYRINFTK